MGSDRIYFSIKSQLEKLEMGGATGASVALTAFIFAWEQAKEDYVLRLINSEHTLQSAVYFHMRRCLPPNYIVYTEAVIRLSSSAVEQAEKIKTHIDLLICRNTEIVCAVELKYSPRGIPSSEKIKKDVYSLSGITRRKSLKDRANIEMPRFRHSDGTTLRLTIARPRELVLAVFFDGRQGWLSGPKQFWPLNRPSVGYWSKFAALPRHLVVALAEADANGSAVARYFGRSVDDLKASHEFRVGKLSVKAGA